MAETLGDLMAALPIAASDLAQSKSFVTYTAPHDLATSRAPLVTLGAAE